MRELTAQMVVDAYVSTGLKPERRSFMSSFFEGKPQCGCGMTALYLDTGTAPEFDCYSGGLVMDWAGKQFGPYVASGFVDGFDNPHKKEPESFPYPSDIREQQYEAGYKIGQEVARLLDEKGLLEL